MKTKAKKLVSTKNMTKQDWLIWRQRGFGGSDIAGLLDMNPRYTSPLKVYISKVEEVEQEEETSEAAEWGTILEPVIREQFKKRHPDLRVQQSHFMWQHPEHEFMLANVDGFVYDKEKGWGVLEIKTASEYLLKKWDSDDGLVPEEYLLQAQHYLAVLGLNWGWFAVLIGGNKYREFYFERDQELIDYLIICEKDFWNNHIIPQIPPALDGSDASEEIIKRLYPADEAKPETQRVVLPAEAGELLEQLDETKEQIKELERQKKEAENKLKQFIGEYQRASFLDREIKWSRIESEKFDSKKLKEEHPELYKKYIKKSVYRRFSA